MVQRFAEPVEIVLFLFEVTGGDEVVKCPMQEYYIPSYCEHPKL